jgi:hypothetical protein
MRNAASSNLLFLAFDSNVGGGLNIGTLFKSSMLDVRCLFPDRPIPLTNTRSGIA